MSAKRISTRRGPGRRGDLSDLAGIMSSQQIEDTVVKSDEPMKLGEYQPVTEVQEEALIESDVVQATAPSEPLADLVTKFVVGAVDGILPETTEQQPSEPAPAPVFVETIQDPTMQVTTTFAAPQSIADMIRNQAMATKDEIRQGLPALDLENIVKFTTNAPGSLGEFFMNIYALLPGLDNAQTRAMRKATLEQHVEAKGEDRAVIMGDSKKAGHVFIYSDDPKTRCIVMRGLRDNGFVVIRYTETIDLSGVVDVMISKENAAILTNDYQDYAALLAGVHEFGIEAPRQCVIALCDNPKGLATLMARVGDVQVDKLLEDPKEVSEREVILMVKKEDKKEVKEDKKG